MRTSRPLAATTVAAVAVLLTACGDSNPTGASAPSALPPSASILQSQPYGVTQFNVSPGSPQTAVIGDHKIVFDKYAICDLDASGYGPDTWDQPCTPTRSTIRITATYWTDLQGNPQIDFWPAMRFNPASSVVLYMKDKSALETNRIFWIDAFGRMVDESVNDPSVATQVGTNGFKFRRIKHFSGYVITTGRDDLSGTSGSEPTSSYLNGPRTPMSVPAPEQLNSGHVVATGAVAEGQLQQQ